MDDAEKNRPDNNQAETILVVDDDHTIRQVLSEVLEHSGLRCLTARNAEEALEVIGAETVWTVITDIRMPGMSGLELLTRVKKIDPDLPVIVMTGSTDRQPLDYIDTGADDFVAKPFRLDAMSFAAAKAVRLRRQALITRDRFKKLERSKLTACNHFLSLELIKAVAELIEIKDPFLRGHAQRVRLLCRKMASLVGYDEVSVERLESAALLHDVGRIAVPGRILNKSDSLEMDEYDQVKRHPVFAQEMLEHLKYLGPSLAAIRSHHERFDGQGYPDGLGGDGIPLDARIVAVADAYDAMTSRRPHRQAMSHDRAMAELGNGRGQQLDPDLVDVFFRHEVPRQALA